MAGGGYDLVDPAGVIVRWSQARPAGLPLYLTSLPGRALRGNSGLATAAAVLAELPSWLSPQVATVSAAAADGSPKPGPGDALPRRPQDGPLGRPRPSHPEGQGTRYPHPRGRALPRRERPGNRRDQVTTRHAG